MIQQKSCGARHAIMATTMFFLLPFALLFLCPHKAQAQFTRTYGTPQIRELGHVLLPERNTTGALTGNLFIGGSRADSNLVLLVDPDGNILNEMTFKIFGAGSMEQLTDLRYDNANLSLLGCGRIPNTSDHTGYAFRLNPTTNTLMWGQRFANTSLCAAIMQERMSAAGMPPEVAVFGVHYVNGHYANFVRLAFNTGAIIAGSSRVYVHNEGPDDHLAAEAIPGPTNTGYLSTGRWAYTSSSRTFRSNLFRSAANGNMNYNGMLFGDADDTLRTYGMDVMATGLGTTLVPHVLTFGDFEGTDLAGNATFAVSRHNPDSGAVTWAEHYDIEDFDGETVQEFILNDAGNYVVYGSSNDTLRKTFLVEIDSSSGNVLWAWQYDAAIATSDSASHITQSQLVNLNNSFYFIATRRTNNEHDILLVRTTLGGELPGCDFEALTLTPRPIGGYFPITADTMGTNQGNLQNVQVQDPNMPTEIQCTGCFASGNANYMQITEDLIINGNEDWPAKVYVADGVMVTITNGVLDITNCDVVFGTCAGIRVGDGGHLRLNNSVLRPCDETTTWVGIVFNGGTGVVNSSTFKNALTAIDMPGNTVEASPFDVRITGNEFINCLRAVRLSNGILSEGITGNHFTLDNRQIDYNPAPCATAPLYSNQHVGVDATNARFQGLISHNEFINTSDPDSPKQLFGLSWFSSRGSITGNRFTNNIEAISLNACTFTSIENNIMDLTLSMRTPTSAQIRVNSGGNSIWISGNHLVNSIESVPAQSLTLAWSAIFLQSCRSVNCKENEIDGFVNGIFAQTLSSSNISENKIRNANLNGIIVEDGRDLTVSCNEIWMRNHIAGAPATIGLNYRRTGIFPANTTSANQPRFMSNCVFNARTAMQVNRLATTFSMPVITNNYFYNYTAFGLFNSNFTGSVGTAITPFASSGHNSFVSNNIPTGVLDVSSNVAITMFSNFGVNNVSALVTVMGNGLFNSNTACGHQIGAAGEQYLPTDFCDQYTQVLEQDDLRIGRGDYSPITSLPETGNLRLDLALREIVGLCEEDAAAAADLLAFLGNGALSPEAYTMLQYTYHACMQDWVTAQSYLNELAPLSPEWSALAAIRDLLLQEATQGRQPWQLSAGSVNALHGMDVSRGAYAELARQILHHGDINHNFLYPEAPEALEAEPDAPWVNLATEKILLAPNPASQTVNAIIIMEHTEGARLAATDMLGREIWTTNVDANHLQMEIDISTWAKGIYQIAIRRPGLPNLQQKLIKF